MNAFQMDEMSKRYMIVEYTPIDIKPYAQGNCGIPYVWTYESGVPGPHVMVSGLMHGNEIAGAAILDRLISNKVRPLKGKLTFCFGNPQAYFNFDADAPYLNRYIDVDINRIWGKELRDLSDKRYEVCRARQLQPLMQSVDYLLDIHTMQGVGKPVALMQRKGASLSLIEKLTNIPFVLTGTMHHPDRLRLRDFGQFGDVSSHAVAIQLEAGQHWQAAAIDEGEQIALQFLEAIGTIDFIERSVEQPQRRLKIVDIIMPEDGVFEYAQDFENGAFLPKKGSLVGYAGAERKEIRTSQDDCYFIMPVHFRLGGGSAGRLAVEM